MVFGKGPRPIGRCSIHPVRPLRRPLAGPHKVTDIYTRHTSHTKESIVSRREQLHFSLDPSSRNFFSLSFLLPPLFHRARGDFVQRSSFFSFFFFFSFFLKQTKNRFSRLFVFPSNFRIFEFLNIYYISSPGRLFSEMAATCRTLGDPWKQYGRLTNGHKLRNRVRGYEPLRRISVMPITIQWVPWAWFHTLYPRKTMAGPEPFGVPRPGNGLRQRVSFDAGETGPGEPALKATMRGVKTKARYTVTILAPAYLHARNHFLVPLYPASTFHPLFSTFNSQRRRLNIWFVFLLHHASPYRPNILALIFER